MADKEWFGDINIEKCWKTYKFSSVMTIGSVLVSLSQRGVDTKGKALVDEGNTPVSQCLRYLSIMHSLIKLICSLSNTILFPENQCG